MDSRNNEENNFSDVIDNLMNMFGKVMSEDVISAVVESCEGDLNLSVDAIMNMTNDGNIISEEEQQAHPALVQPVTQTITTPKVTQPSQPSTSYATISTAKPSQKTGAIPKSHHIPKLQSDTIWTEQIKNIITTNNQGSRILILMRGVPGSGKSYLARKLVDMMVGGGPHNYRTHILTTDDYFMIRGQYQYDKFRLSEAHAWNQQRARSALRMGLSPVIIDNTNIELWEMEPYLREGVKNGYIIEVVEPTTPWAKKANILMKKNVHNVPLVSIKRMLENYREGITGEMLKNSYGLSYPRSMVPPVQRKVPYISKEEKSPKDIKPDTTAATTAPASASTTQTNPKKQFFNSSASSDINTENADQQMIDVNRKQQETSQSQIPNNSNDLGTPWTQQMVDDLLAFHAHEKMQQETSRKEIPDTPWTQQMVDDMLAFHAHDKRQEETSPKEIPNNLNAHNSPKTQETVNDIFGAHEKKLEEFVKVEIEWENGDNWEVEEQASKEIGNSKTSAQSTVSTPEAKPQRKPRTSSDIFRESTQTLMQNVGDCHDWSKISMFMPSWDDTPTLPNVTVANEVSVETTSSGTCMEIGDTNVNGKYKVITASPRNINLHHISFQREKIPQKRMLDKSSMTNEVMLFSENDFVCPNQEQHFISFRKMFKNIARSDLRDIFDKCRGDVNWSVEIVLDGMSNNQLKTLDTEELSDPEEDSLEQCSCLAQYNIIPDIATPSVSETPTPKKEKVTVANKPQSQKKKRDVPMSEETIQIKRQIEQNVVIADNHYSKHCLKIRKIRRGEPDVEDNDGEELGAAALSQATSSDCSVPVDMEVSDDENDSSGSSVSGVDDDLIVTFNLGHSFIAELDEKLGRKGIEYPSYIVPKISVPMSLLNEFNALWMESLTFQLDEHANQAAAMMQQDEDFARELELKEAEMSLAGKEPEVPDFKEIMDMDMALAIYQKDVAEWRNNMPTDLAAKMTRDKLFNLFPEVLLTSTGRSDVLEQENGVNKFVMAEEMKLKDKILEEQKKANVLSANRVLIAYLRVYCRNYQKAQDYIRRGMTQVANYYSELANFHKQKYEYANSLAVASLMQFHATKNPDSTTIDLHYLRVKEARESLDIFIDTHISKLRDSGVRRNQMLFFITGRGSHSQGRARIKPATIERLKQRGLGYTLKNPGLLAAKVNVDTKLTYQVSVP
ncbi:hypothetical protein HF086_004821 [Spodoptera exigua]|uniref:Smr domain-containing protein n=1 Tax=Spodoptera exigua TaxID=7107 RepID=A0A922M4Q8_SPOEX|nr:hypothetical protein HF086_004821 [Spodoptera exigua]